MSHWSGSSDNDDDDDGDDEDKPFIQSSVQQISDWITVSVSAGVWTTFATVTQQLHTFAPCVQNRIIAATLKDCLFTPVCSHQWIWLYAFSLSSKGAESDKKKYFLKKNILYTNRRWKSLIKKRSIYQWKPGTGTSCELMDLRGLMKFRLSLDRLTTVYLQSLILQTKLCDDCFSDAAVVHHRRLNDSNFPEWPKPEH